PDIFLNDPRNPGPNYRHAMFIQNVSGSGTDTQGEVLGVSIEPTPVTGGAALLWRAVDGFADRQHATSSAVKHRVDTHTWHDYRAALYSFDGISGAVVANQNAASDGHGFFDLGALGWDDSSIVAGGFSGNIIRYTDDGTGTTHDQIYKFTTEDCAPNWF